MYQQFTFCFCCLCTVDKKAETGAGAGFEPTFVSGFDILVLRGHGWSTGRAHSGWVKGSMCRGHKYYIIDVHTSQAQYLCYERH